MSWYLKSTKHPNLKFKIVTLNKQTMQAKLLGGTGVPFTHSITKEDLKKYGYEIVKVEDHETSSV